MAKIKTFGSICSGIEAASFVFVPKGVHPIWFSEIADFQSRFLSEKYPTVNNLGDMNDIPSMIKDGIIDVPDMLCGGTPCQAFSLAGWRKGINDDRGQLTLKYIDILNAIDAIRLSDNKGRAVFFWENVEGALTDKTNAFGCFLSGLAGLSEPLMPPAMNAGKKRKRKESTGAVKWSKAGVLYGKDRNIAWRVLDAKYFGVPQQRKRVYVLGGGKDFNPEKVLFETGDMINDPLTLNSADANKSSLFEEEFGPSANDVCSSLIKTIDGNQIEAFRSYSDCLYAAYGTKWNGNAAALNGSLFFSQNGRLRRLSPLECERLMGFPDNYTLLEKCRDTQRYQAVGNSWAVPVVKWIADRLIGKDMVDINLGCPHYRTDEFELYLFDGTVATSGGDYINATYIPYDYKLTNMIDIADVNVTEKFYITKAGCAGILRRKREYNQRMNERLNEVLTACAGFD